MYPWTIIARFQALDIWDTLIYKASGIFINSAQNLLSLTFNLLIFSRDVRVDIIPNIDNIYPRVSCFKISSMSASKGIHEYEIYGRTFTEEQHPTGLGRFWSAAKDMTSATTAQILLQIRNPLSML